MSRLPTFDPDLYFGDMPLETFARLGSGVEPWQSFERARGFRAEGDMQQARATLESIARAPEIESRIRLQAWHALRELGELAPGDLANDVLGVVVEVDMSAGQDFLAGYSDHTAYYYNYSGAAVVWLRPDGSLDGQIDSVLAAARAIVPLIGPWEGPRRPPPQAGMARLNILTPAGLHFGEAPLRALDGDRNARPLLRAATALMARLTELPRRPASDRP